MKKWRVPFVNEQGEHVASITVAAETPTHAWYEANRHPIGQWFRPAHWDRFVEAPC